MQFSLQMNRIRKPFRKKVSLWLKYRATIPTSNAAMMVPSRTPVTPPDNSSDVMHASVINVQSKPIFTHPNSFFFFCEIACTNASPDSITTLAITSRLTPNPKMIQPKTRVIIFQR